MRPDPGTPKTDRARARPMAQPLRARAPGPHPHQARARPMAQPLHPGTKPRPAAPQTPTIPVQEH